LQTYKTPAASSGYSLKDHPYLLSSPVKELFEAFRKAALEIDPCVTEDFLKLYVAYKAESNFVDVVPQAKRLRLSLNMRFHEINDPRKLCKNVAELGRWGNGEAEVMFSSLDELPYIMSLVQQAFARQMGNGEIE
jgi:predicted transport protein